MNLNRKLFLLILLVTIIAVYFCRYAYSLKTQLNDKEKLGGKLSSDDKKTVEDAVEEQIKWLESNQGAEVDELKEHKKQLEEIVSPIITKLYGEGGTGDVPPPPPHGHDDDSL
jgi:heat shock protein 5